MEKQSTQPLLHIQRAAQELRDKLQAIPEDQLTVSKISYEIGEKVKEVYGVFLAKHPLPEGIEKHEQDDEHMKSIDKLTQYLQLAILLDPLLKHLEQVVSLRETATSTIGKGDLRYLMWGENVKERFKPEVMVFLTKIFSESGSALLRGLVEILESQIQMSVLKTQGVPSGFKWKKTYVKLNQGIGTASSIIATFAEAVMITARRDLEPDAVTVEFVESALRQAYPIILRMAMVRIDMIVELQKWTAAWMAEELTFKDGKIGPRVRASHSLTAVHEREPAPPEQNPVRGARMGCPAQADFGEGSAIKRFFDAMANQVHVLYEDDIMHA